MQVFLFKIDFTNIHSIKDIINYSDNVNRLSFMMSFRMSHDCADCELDRTSRSRFRIVERNKTVS
jgi:hypothetical protein